MFGQGMSDYIKELHAENGRLRAALTALDAVLDFSEPGSEDKPMIFEDWSDLNAAFDLAREALTHEQDANK